MLKFFLILFSLNAHAEMSITTKMDNFWRTTTVYPQYQKSLHQKKYLRWNQEINPFVPKPFVSISDTTRDYDNNIIYNVFYNTEELGLRVTPEVKKGLAKHLIVAGDSNTFGIGCTDTQTLPYYLSKKLPDYNVVNFGLGGTGSNSTLRFLETFTIKDMAPQNYKKGMFVLDFHIFTIDRIVGTKNFLHWGATAPQYTLKNDVPVYQGPFSESWQKFFYTLLEKLPYSQELFPDLPRIGSEHIELAARIIEAIKKKYLEQTSPDNKFVVFMNPEYKEQRPIEFRTDPNYLNRKALAKKLREYKIDVVEFKDNEVVELKHFDIEGHYAPEGQEAYAGMVYKKLMERM